MGETRTIDHDGRTEYSFSYYDTREPDSSASELLALGLQAGGETWAGIVQGLLALKAPLLARQLELDPEGDGLVVRSTRRAAIVRLAKLVAAAKRDRTLLVAAVDRARLGDWLE